MMRWPLGTSGDIAARFTESFRAFLEGLIPIGAVWEAGDALGAAVWLGPSHVDAWRSAQREEEGMRELADAPSRYDAFWAWIENRLPGEPLWHLDSVGVAPHARKQGIGKALIKFGLRRAQRDGIDAFLETGNEANVAYYGRLGFRVVDEAAAPDGGPSIWFMRWSAGDRG
jgi:ribosomal protein S18 acetylase RimI-like enzyme